MESSIHDWLLTAKVPTPSSFEICHFRGERLWWRGCLRERRELLHKGLENWVNRRRRVGLNRLHFAEYVGPMHPTLERHEDRARRAALESDDDLEKSKVSVDMSDATKCPSGVEKALICLVWWCLNPNGVATVFSDKRVRSRGRGLMSLRWVCRLWNEAIW